MKFVLVVDMILINIDPNQLSIEKKILKNFKISSLMVLKILLKSTVKRIRISLRLKNLLIGMR